MRVQLIRVQCSKWHDRGLYRLLKNKQTNKKPSLWTIRENFKKDLS